MSGRPGDTRGLVTSGMAQEGLGTVPTNESRLLGLCVRISFGGKVQRKDAPILREHRGRRSASLEHHVFSTIEHERLKCKT
jgi:hypothetical protein